MKLLSVSDGPEEKVITVRRSLIKPWLLLNTEFLQCTFRLWDGKNYKRKTPMNFFYSVSSDPLASDWWWWWESF